MIRLTIACRLGLGALPASVAPRAEPRRRSTCSPASPNGARWPRSWAATRSTSSAPRRARQDPHQIQARPSLIARLRTADLVVCTGAELEIGWMPMLLRQAANGRTSSPAAPAISRRRDMCGCSRCRRGSTAPRATSMPPATRISRPTRAISRRSPTALAARMQQLDPANAAAIAAATQNFMARWAAAMQRWTAQAAPLRGRARSPSITRTGSIWRTGWACARSATIEPKPGVPPGSQYLAQLVSELPAQRRARRPLCGL